MSAKFKDLEVLRAGEFTDANGRKVTITESDLSEMASSFDPTKWKAPYVKGHPKDNDPAQGYPESFHVKDGKLFAKTKQLFGEFKEQLQKGLFSKISLSIFDRDSPSNPSPGKLSIRHVGFLGAVPPAVTGLANVELSSDDKHFEIELSCEPEFQESLTQKIKSIVAEMLPKKPAAEPELSEQKPNEENTMAELTPDEVAKLQADLAAANAKTKELETNLSMSAKKARDDDFVSFCEGLVNEQKMVPAMKDLWVEFAAQLPMDEIEFSEGKATMIDKVKAILSHQDKILDFTEKSKPTDKKVPTVEFSAPNGHEVDDQDLETLAKVKAYAKEHKCSTSEAAIAVGA